MKYSLYHSGLSLTPASCFWNFFLELGSSASEKQNDLTTKQGVFRVQTIFRRDELCMHSLIGKAITEKKKCALLKHSGSCCFFLPIAKVPNLGFLDPFMLALSYRSNELQIKNALIHVFNKDCFGFGLLWARLWGYSSD